MTLREVLTAYGITPKLLTQRLGFSRQYAHMLWHGQRHLGVRLGARIAQACDIPLEHLLLPETITPEDVVRRLEAKPPRE
jgi:hypothetical protein